MVLQSSQRARELERKYQARRGHVPQISISDDNHHVTEAIGDMYGDADYEPTSNRMQRPLSFVASPQGDKFEVASLQSLNNRPSPGSQLRESTSNDRTTNSPNGSPKIPSSRSPSFPREDISRSPPTLSRTHSETASQQFPLNDIDYESSPAAVAQELSNLQAIRRMSMDVNASDPDLPSFSSGFAIPTLAPSHSDDENDTSRLFWVPARLHPELAPKEFKTFIEDKVEKIKRRSGGEDTLSPEGVDRQGSGGGLRRKKSMLSKQIDGPNGYKDGAERLEKKRSLAGHKDPSILEFESLISDPSSIVRRLSIDQTRRSSEDGMEVPVTEDMPILPLAPAGQSLKRSTRTNYRRGSLRKGERVPFSKRMAGRQVETDTEESPATSPIAPSHPDLPHLGLTRVHTEPIPPRGESAENFSRPGRKRSPPITVEQSYTVPPVDSITAPSESGERRSPQPRAFHSRIASNGRTTAPLPGYNPPIPQIIETPPPETQRTPVTYNQQFPARTSSKSSYNQNQSAVQHPVPTRDAAQPRSQNRQPLTAPLQHQAPLSQTFDDIVTHPSPLPGNSTRTDSLTLIPTLSEDKQAQRRSKDKKDASDSAGRKTSWGWLLGSEDKEKEKEKERERKEKEEKEPVRKGRLKLSRSSEKVHDNTRLDVLQSSIDGGSKGRESVVINRESFRLEEERKKESNRKATGSDGSKGKDSGLFSSLFGGKKRSDRDSGGKKSSSQRGLSPEPPPRVLKPDIDYNWTRFSIMEERAIYRMAHLKLANPRRELYSQVLLSNFMYSYLAKVQQMHPQVQIGQSATPKQQERLAQQRKKEQQQPEEFSQYQRYQEQQARDDAGSGDKAAHGVHHSTVQSSTDQEGHGEYDTNQDDTSDSQSSQYAHSSAQSRRGKSSGGYSVSSGQNYLGQPAAKHQDGFYQRSSFDDDGGNDAKDDDMW
ncbi:hypothetical protein M501DRAFT_937743 [Patellaria atrata CBS 101060]|uniref:Protein Zds1 C-terminal domain-containing protein n=1 Tax=Patellaria atrata CBS 101060 TaxID=1346257 RepID=A0A9P4S9C7_9PEZI|nr:hypothetical protein M501DRAFT_937743 [Patellaria atrata CBS 101060]